MPWRAAGSAATYGSTGAAVGSLCTPVEPDAVETRLAGGWVGDREKARAFCHFSSTVLFHRTAQVDGSDLGQAKGYIQATFVVLRFGRLAPLPFCPPKGTAGLLDAGFRPDKEKASLVGFSGSGAMSQSIDAFVEALLDEGKNTREIISAGRTKRFAPVHIMRAVQRTLAQRRVMDAKEDSEPELSSDEEPQPTERSASGGGKAETPRTVTDDGGDAKVPPNTGAGDAKVPPGGGWGDSMATEEGDEAGWGDLGNDGDENDGWGDEDAEDASGWGGIEEDGADGKSDSDILEGELAPPVLARAPSYQIYDSKSVADRQKVLVDRVSELLFVSTDEASCLLRGYRWNEKKLQSEWFKDQKKVRDKIGLTARRATSGGSAAAVTADPSSNPQEATVQCLTWGCKRVPVRKAHALACGHSFCKGCWRKYLSSEISKGRTAIFATCPAMRCTLNHVHKFGCGCTELVPQSTFEKFVKDKALLEKYTQWILKSFVEGQDSLKWCPNPRCHRIVEYKQGGERTIECACNWRFCFMCSKKEHEPAPCDLVAKWLGRAAVSDQASEQLLRAITKKCPNCGIRIQKNKACNHMTCTNCGHHFCWLCKGPWSEHGSATGGFYVCKVYNERVEKGTRSQEEKDLITTQQMLQKYKYYLSRFNDSKNGVALTRKVEQQLEEKFRVHNYSVDDTKFVGDAIAALIKARTCMQWCYALDFYLISGKEKKLFEFQQGLLIDHTESLQDTIESALVPTKAPRLDKKRVDPTADEKTSLDELMMKKKAILSKTTSLNNLRKRVIQLVKEGSFEDFLSYKADTKSDHWLCTNCETANKTDRVSCRRCGGCKLHGEIECRACNRRRQL